MTKSKLTTTIGVATYEYRRIKFIQASAWWATDLTLRGKQIDPVDFNVTMMDDCIDEEKLGYEDGEKNSYIEKPNQLSHRKWISW